MGTVVTVCMFIGLVYALLLKFINPIHQFPPFVHAVVGGLVTAAGAWNVFWYASRHLMTFWGLAALVSGIALMLTGFYIIKRDASPTLIKTITPVVLLVLFVCMMLYGITIYRL
ncbi:MAG: hypothetical protein KTR35_17615 [Gammaproteobacteria bacterium]|nr:hypothetical protein [Gammaproteobacteria bacterium]